MGWIFTSRPSPPLAVPSHHQAGRVGPLGPLFRRKIAPNAVRMRSGFLLGYVFGRIGAASQKVWKTSHFRTRMGATQVRPSRYAGQRV